MIIDAMKLNAIINAQNNPNIEKKPIGENEMMAKPVTSETAEPINARPEAPPIATREEWTERPLSRSSR